jgi:hypothetical protein
MKHASSNLALTTKHLKREQVSEQGDYVTFCKINSKK